MQVVARISGSDRDLSWDDGRFLLDGTPVPLDKVLEYDALGVLGWVDEETRRWALSTAAGPPVAAPAVPAVAAPAEPAPAPDTPPAAPAPPATPAPAPDTPRARLDYVVLAEMLLTLGAFLAIAIWIPAMQAKVLATVIGLLYSFAIMIAFGVSAAAAPSSKAKVAWRIGLAVLTIGALTFACPVAMFAGFEAARPVQIRAEGQFPPAPAMLAADGYDALRMLGATDKYQPVANDPLAFRVDLPDVPVADPSVPAVCQVSVSPQARITTIGVSMATKPGAYRDLAQLLRDRMGYTGRITGAVAQLAPGAAGVGRLVDARPACGIVWAWMPNATTGVDGISVLFAREVPGGNGPVLSASDLAFSASAYRGD